MISRTTGRVSQRLDQFERTQTWFWKVGLKKGPLDPWMGKVTQIFFLCHILLIQNPSLRKGSRWTISPSLSHPLFLILSFHIKFPEVARCRWLTPVILATQEAEIRRIMI
jgi:hypothetical protein